MTYIYAVTDMILKIANPLLLLQKVTIRSLWSPLLLERLLMDIFQMLRLQKLDSFKCFTSHPYVSPTIIKLTTVTFSTHIFTTVL